MSNRTRFRTSVEPQNGQEQHGNTAGKGCQPWEAPIQPTCFVSWLSKLWRLPEGCDLPQVGSWCCHLQNLELPLPIIIAYHSSFIVDLLPALLRNVVLLLSRQKNWNGESQFAPGRPNGTRKGRGSLGWARRSSKNAWSQQQAARNLQELHSL